MQTRLEHYIETTTATLKTLPEVDREQEVAEICGHLEAIIAARVAGGATADQAVEAAIQQFDADRQVGAELRLTARRSRLRRSRPEVVAAAFGLAVGGSAEMLTWIPGAFLLPLHRPDHAVLLRLLFATPIPVLGTLCMIRLLAAAGIRGVWREARRADTPWGLAAQWAFWTHMPLLGWAAALSQVLTGSNFLPRVTLPWEVAFGPLLTGAIAYLLARYRASSASAPGGIVATASTIAIVTLPASMYTVLSQLGRNWNAPYLLLVGVAFVPFLYAAPPVLGALLGARLRLRALQRVSFTRRAT